MRFPGFVGPSYQMRSINVDCQRCINLYPELDEIGTEKEGEIASLVGTPGLSTPLITLGSGPIRGLYVASQGTIYVVSGNKLYYLTLSAGIWSSTSVGTINSSTGTVSMADNGIDLVLVDGTDGWYTPLGTASLTQITGDAWLGSTMVSVVDGYFVFIKPNSFEYYVSDLESVNLNALNFASKESPDFIVGIAGDHRNLWLFGSKTTEVWYNAGNPTGVPFSIIQGGYLEIGCIAPFSIQKMNNSLFWLGCDKDGQGQVFMTSGYAPQRISTHPVELAIQSYGDLSKATSWCYQENGHHFYCLNFPGGTSTWVFDSATSLWHERCYLNSGIFERSRPECHAFSNNIHIVGDYQNGNVYQLSSTVYTDNGNPLIKQRIAPHLAKDMDRIVYARFQLDLEPGVGLDGSGQGTSPQAILQFSDDGGHTWSNEKWTSIGAIGQTKARAIWRRLGQSRDRVFKITISDPVKTVLIGAEIDLMQEAS